MRASLVPALVCLALAYPATSTAEAPPPDAAAVEQYRESLPTSSGLVVVGSSPETVIPLPPAIAEGIRAEAGEDAPLLERVATSSAFGAPHDPMKPRDTDRLERRPGSAPPSEWSLGAGVRSGAGALADVGNSARLSLLLVVCLGIAAAGLAAALRRRGDAGEAG